MVELQSHLEAFEAAGVSLFVVLYEPVELLARFADEFDVAVPLLSDPKSRIIREVGILNTTLDDSDAPFFGIPYPGAFVIGADGRVEAKFFEQNSLIRAHPDRLLRAALGEVETDEAKPPGSVDPVAEVEMTVRFDADELRAFLISDLVVTLRVPPGQHLYGPPVSDGLVVTSVELDEVENITSQMAVVPPTRPFELGGTGETLHIYEGDVEIRIPLVYNAMPVGVDEAGRRAVPVSGTVRWQSCDDTTCHIPRTERFSVSVPVGNANIPTNIPGFLDDLSEA